MEPPEGDNKPRMSRFDVLVIVGIVVLVFLVAMQIVGGLFSEYFKL